MINQQQLTMLGALLCLFPLLSCASVPTPMLDTPLATAPPVAVTPMATTAPPQLVANNLNVAENSAILPTVEQKQPKPVRVQIDAFLLGTDDAGQPQAWPINADTPLKVGNVVLYRTTYTNQSPDRIRQMTATVTIPDGMQLLGKIQPERAWASADHNVFSVMPLKFREAGVLKELPYEYYKALRWHLKDIDLNGSVSVGYTAVVVNPTPN